MNSSVTPGVVARLHGGEQVGRPRAPSPVDESRRTPAASGPTACRGPSPSSGRRRSRSGRAGSSARSRTAEVGETSRPSVNAWIHVFSGAKRSSACRWSMCEWTPPCETRPSRCTRLPARSRPQHGVLEERAVVDRLVDAHQILVEPPARADRQVADLAVAHLPGRQPGSLARRLERRVRVRRARAGRTPASRRARRRCPARAARSPSRRG